MHGFKPNSNAERQGLILIGDEILAINAINIQGKYLEDVVRAFTFGASADAFVPVIVRRHVQISGGTLLDDDDDDDNDGDGDGVNDDPAAAEEEEEEWDDTLPAEAFIVKRVSGSPLKVSLRDIMTNSDLSEMEFSIPKVASY